MRALASQAAVAVENNLLYESIERLFEGFVTAAVTAIEQRDPTTSGHSFRVAELTVELARVIDRIDDGQLRDVRFTTDQIREIRYASLLHDFGKVGVREQVLVKEKKLYPLQIEMIRARFEFVMKARRERGQSAQARLPPEEWPRRGYEAFSAQVDGESQAAIQRAAEGLRIHRPVERADRAAGRGVPVPAAAGHARVRRLPRTRASCCSIRKRRACSRSARATSIRRAAWRSRATSPTPSTSS